MLHRHPVSAEAVTAGGSNSYILTEVGEARNPLCWRTNRGSYGKMVRYGGEDAVATRTSDGMFFQEKLVVVCSGM